MRRSKQTIAIAILLFSTILVLDLSAQESEKEISKIAVIVHPSNAQKIDKKSFLKFLKRVWEREELKWKNGTPILPLDLPAKEKLRLLFSKKVLKKTPNQMKEHYVKVKIQARANPPQPKVQKSLVAIALIVSKVKGAIAYMPLEEAEKSKKIKIAFVIDLKKK